MNWVDLIIIVIVAVNSFIAWKSGFVRTICDFCSTIVSLIFTYMLYPVTANFLRNLNWFDKIKNTITESFDFSENFENISQNSQISIINQLEFPDFIKNAIIENNNSQTYELLNASGIEEYIAGYIANLCVNAISIITTFIIIVIAVKIFIEVLDLVSKLPILNFVNKTAGIAIGALRGLLIIWIIFLGVMFFYSKPNLQPFIVSIEESALGSFLYHNNILAFMVTNLKL